MSRLRTLAGPFFIVAGALHFIRPRLYRAMMPPWVPAPDAMVADSFEVLAENLPFNEAGSLIGKTAELHVTHMVPRNVGVRLQAKVFPVAAGK